MQMNILVVDDDDEFIELIAEILKDNNYFVNTANDGEKALSLIEAETYNIVLLDLKLPKINGITVLEYLKKNKPDIKVIILTGAPINENISEGQKVILDENKYNQEIIHLADYVINKPFEIDDLLEKIKLVLY